MKKKTDTISEASSYSPEEKAVGQTWPALKKAIYAFVKAKERIEREEEATWKESYKAERERKDAYGQLRRLLSEKSAISAWKNDDHSMTLRKDKGAGWKYGETAFQHMIARLCDERGYKVFHTHSVTYGLPEYSKGFPDLVIFLADRVIFAEVKVKAKIKPEQSSAILQLQYLGYEDSDIWGPGSWEDINEILGVPASEYLPLEEFAKRHADLLRHSDREDS